MFVPCVIIFFALFCFSCQKSTEEQSSGRHQLELSFKYEPLTIDPRKNADVLSCSLIFMLYEGLTHLEPDGSVSFGLAESVEISKNNTRYIFHLKDARWSNGEPITSYDIESSWKRILSPDFNSINAYFLYPIKNAQSAKLGRLPVDDIGLYVKDEKTFTIQLEQPNPYFLKMLAFVTYFPIWKGNCDQKDLTTSAVFSGPFILEQWQANSFLLLKKNPFFWNASRVNLDTIRINIIPDEHVAFKLHELNEIDWLGAFTSPIPLEEIPRVSKSSQALTIECAGTTMCFFNTHSFPFSNVNIRKAFSYAIQKQEIIDHICQNHETLAYGIIPPILKNHRHTKFIPDNSKELARHHFKKGLQECGLQASQFPKLTFTFYSSTLEKTIALALQQQWKAALDVEVTLECMDVKVFLDKLYKRNYQFALMSIVAQYFDCMNILDRFLSSESLKNFCCWENATFKQLIDSSFDAITPEERLFILEKAESVLMSDAPVAPIYHHTITYLKNKAIEGVQVTPIGSVDFRNAYFVNE